MPDTGATAFNQRFILDKNAPTLRRDVNMSFKLKLFFLEVMIF